MNLLWGIDLGGTKVECAVLDADNDYKEVARDRIPANHKEGYNTLLQNIAQFIEDLSSKLGSRPTKLGIGTPGIIDEQSGLMINCHNTCLLNKPFKQDLSELLGLEVRVANDANCFALAEAVLGSGSGVKDARMVFGVIMGTGVGGGLVLDQKVWNGKNRIAAEFGHTVISDQNQCNCGRTGCIETFISGPSLEKYYESRTGEFKKLKYIIELARNKEDDIAVETFNRLIKYFGKAMGNIINMLDPDVIVIGGGLANIDELYQEGIQAVAEEIFMDEVRTPILRPKLGGSAGVYGAAFL